jgi:hypothetical protein
MGRARRSLRAWWAAVSSGRFLTAWSAVISGVIACTVLGPYMGDDAPTDVAAGLVSAAVSWLVLVVLLLPVAWAERRMPQRTARGVLVLGALLAASAVRPFLNDAVLWLLFDEPSTGVFASRVATNVLSWLVLLSLIGMVSSRYEMLAETRHRLRDAVAVLSGTEGGVCRLDVETTRVLEVGVASLRESRERMLAGHLDFDAASGFAADVRSLSHSVYALMHAPVTAGGGAGEDSAGASAGAAGSTAGDSVKASRRAGQARAPRGPRNLLLRVRPPLWGIVAALYSIVSVPFLLQSAGPWLLAVAVAVQFAVGLTADDITRRQLRIRSRARRVAAMVAVWAPAGVVVAAVGWMIVPSIGLALPIPVVAFPLLAVICGMAADAQHRSEVETRRLTVALRAAPPQLAERIARTRERLSRAADLLHGRVQGRCVIFAAHLDEHEATDEVIARFRDGTEEAFAAVLAVEAPDAGAETIDGLLETWAPVVTVTGEIDPAASEALADTTVSRRVTEVVNEGLVNAVKHSTARSASLGIDAVGDALRVRLVTRGELAAGVASDGHGLASIGGHLMQQGRDVVLEAVVTARRQVGSLQESDSM